ncbi:hypothetical protein ACFPRL_23565 [Pseudoclavibacter helvolus]
MGHRHRGGATRAQPEQTSSGAPWPRGRLRAWTRTGRSLQGFPHARSPRRPAALGSDAGGSGRCDPDAWPSQALARARCTRARPCAPFGPSHGARPSTLFGSTPRVRPCQIRPRAPRRQAPQARTGRRR